MPRVFVPAARWERWVANFVRGHGEAGWVTQNGGLHGTAADGSTVAVRLPFGRSYDGGEDPLGIADEAAAPQDWGVLLVRKGGFAIARMRGVEMTAHKIGQRHVQGRTKAGGQSQQRFARRRDNQARQAYDAAADHAARLLGDGADLMVVTGGDRTAASEVLADPRLATLRPIEPWLATPDPRRRALDQAIFDAQALDVDVTNA